jgi:hypothetical protein
MVKKVAGKCRALSSSPVQGAPQHFADAGQPEGLPANSPPQAKIFEEKTVTFPFLNTNINFNLKSTQCELSKTHILSNTHSHTHTNAHTTVTNTNMKIDLYVMIRITYH